VAKTFAELSARDRALLWLAYVERATHQEIAASLGVGTRSIKVLLFRAKRRLRDLLCAKGLVPGSQVQVPRSYEEPIRNLEHGPRNGGV
jgi:DNA-directed RNA polymerase specialized sigma24 family protein